jgi:hypothetical protein
MEQNVSTLLEARPTAETAFCRAHALGALVQRWEFEQTIQGFDELSIVEIHKGLLADLGRWIDAEELRPYLTDSELALLATPLGHWTPELVEGVGWRMEPLGILVWSLGLIKILPPYDRRCAHDELLMRLRLGKSLEPQRDTIQFRPAEQLDAALEAAELWEWRAQTAAVLKSPQLIPANVDLPAFIASRAASAHRQGLIPEVLENDFPALGLPYRTLPDSQLALLAAIAKERAEALRWLCGRPSSRPGHP